MYFSHSLRTHAFMLSLLRSLVVSCRFNGKEGKKKKKPIQRLKSLKRNYSRSTFLLQQWKYMAFQDSIFRELRHVGCRFQSSLREPSDGVSQKFSKDAHLLLLSCLKSYSYLKKTVKYCFTPSYNHLSLRNVPRSEPACFIHLALK